ncbi:MAG: GlsB/YeaQ/YmgE family stress response membrane protein, partial [Gemmatimonadota bacterium]
MSLLSWIVVGLVAGGLAKLLLPGDDPGGCIVTMIIGIVGAILGGFLFRALFGYEAEGFNLGSIGVALVGSIVLLLLYRLVA